MRICRDRSGISNVIVVMLSLVILVTVVANVVLWSYQMNQLDWEKMRENITIVNATSVVDASQYNPSGYTLGASTNWTSGSVSDLSSNNGVYMAFRSYYSGTDTTDFVDNNTSDVDSSADKGTHSNFAAQQSGPNSINDTLTEENTISNWLGNWSKRVRITIDRNDIGNTLSNFPVLIYLSTSSGWNSSDVSCVFDDLQSEANRKKIAVTTGDGITECYVEIEKWIYPLGSIAETLRPNAAGDNTGISGVSGAATHWQAVDEEAANDDTDYVYTSSSSYQRDLYNLPNHTGSGTINNLTVYFRFETSSGLYTAYARGAIKTYGTVYVGNEESQGSSSYVTRSYTWANNPFTGSSWTWAEIDNLQAGLELRHSGSASSRCTQVYVDVNYTPPSGKAWLWTNVPSISNITDTHLYLYYDAAHADNADFVGDTGSTPARNVWDSSYKGVWHLKEDPSSAAPQMKDSTLNGNNGTSAGSMTLSDQVAAVIDGGLDFDGSNDEITCGNAASLQITTALTIESWAKTSTTGSTMGIVNKEVGSYNGYQLRKHSDNKYRFAVGDPTLYYATSDSAYTDSNWHYIVGVKSTTNYLYVDGVQQASTFTRSITDSGANFDIGRAYSDYNSFWWSGIIDEIRVSNTNRSADWIKAGYESGRDHLLGFGSEQKLAYELDLETQWTNVPYNLPNEELCIFGGTMGSEDIRVDVWNGSAWKNVFTDLLSGWNNVSVSSYLNFSIFTIRFKGANETDDATRDSWNIDVTLLHVWKHEYTSEVEFTGSSNTENWNQLNWTVDSAWTVASVNTTLQLYNYTLGNYSTSENGYIAYTSSDTPNTDETKNQTITVNPTHFRNSTGNWKIKIKGVKTTATQFDSKVDWIEFMVKIPQVIFTFKNSGSLTSHLVSLWVTNSTHHQRYSIDVVINSGETLICSRKDVNLPTGQFMVKVVTERGNIAVLS